MPDISVRPAWMLISLSCRSVPAYPADAAGRLIQDEIRELSG